VTVRNQGRERRGKERYKEPREGGDKGQAGQYAQAGPTKEKMEVQETRQGATIVKYEDIHKDKASVETSQNLINLVKSEMTKTR